MSIEHELVRFVCHTTYKDLNPEPLGTIRNQLLTVLGTTIAGSTQAGCQTLIDFNLAQGGKQEARFRDCIAYAKKPIPKEKVEGIVESVSRIDQLSDVLALIPLVLTVNSLGQEVL